MRHCKQWDNTTVDYVCMKKHLGRKKLTGNTLLLRWQKVVTHDLNLTERAKNFQFQNLKPNLQEVHWELTFPYETYCF